MFVYFSFFPANAFHQTSVPRYALAGGYKRCVYPVCNFSLPVFSTVRLSCSHAGCILWGLSTNTIAFSKPPLLFKAQTDVFLPPSPPGQNQALSGWRCAATSLKFAQPSVNSHPTNHDYFLEQIHYYRQHYHQHFWCGRLRAVKQQEVGAQECERVIINYCEMLQILYVHLILHLQFWWWVHSSISTVSSSDFSVPDKKRGVHSQKQALDTISRTLYRAH